MGSRLENAVRFCVSMISGAPEEAQVVGDKQLSPLATI